MMGWGQILLPWGRWQREALTEGDCTLAACPFRLLSLGTSPKGGGF